MVVQKIGRRRGAILTPVGLRKLRLAKQEREQAANFGDRYTNEELSMLTGLSLKTIPKIFGGAPNLIQERISVDKQTLVICFRSEERRVGKEC